jgi:hypothetical protein
MGIIIGNFFLNRINDLQHASPELSHSLKIVPRGTLFRPRGEPLPEPIREGPDPFKNVPRGAFCGSNSMVKTVWMDPQKTAKEA